MLIISFGLIISSGFPVLVLIIVRNIPYLPTLSLLRAFSIYLENMIILQWVVSNLFTFRTIMKEYFLGVHYWNKPFQNSAIPEMLSKRDKN